MNDEQYESELVKSMNELIHHWHSGDLEVTHPSDNFHDDSWTLEDTDSLIFCIESFLHIQGLLDQPKE
jgi:hypothetical protein